MEGRESLMLFLLAILMAVCGVRGTTTVAAATATPTTLAPAVTQAPSHSKQVVSVTATQQIKPSSVELHGRMSSVAPASATSITVTIKFTSCNATWEQQYANTSSNDFKVFVEDIKFMIENKTYPGPRYDIREIKVPRLENADGKVKVTIKISFGGNLEDGIVLDERFQEFAASAMSDLCVIPHEVTVEGVDLGPWKAKSGECKNKCCNHGGGPITLERSCKREEGAPSDVCERLKSQVVAPNCVDHCTEIDCSSAGPLTASVFLAIAALQFLLIL